MSVATAEARLLEIVQTWRSYNFLSMPGTSRWSTEIPQQIAMFYQDYRQFDKLIAGAMVGLHLNKNCNTPSELQTEAASGLNKSEAKP